VAFLDRIELNPRFCNGKSVMKGARIPVSVMLDQIAAGDSWDDILNGHPELAKEEVQAALLYASALLDHTEVLEVHSINLVKPVQTVPSAPRRAQEK